VQTAADYNEFRACATMIDRSKLENVILVADRGYENYNIFAHAIEKGWKFAIRIKDKNSNGIASGLNFPPNDEFDIDITQIFSRKNTKTTKIRKEPSFRKTAPGTKPIALILSPMD
jgi:hypothetical protein